MEKTELDCRGMACPQPVVETKRKLDTITAGTLSVLVDNETAKNNVLKLAASLSLAAAVKDDQGIYTVTLLKEAAGLNVLRDTLDKSILISAETFGVGNNKLGKILMKSFCYALAESDNLPKAIFLINGGVKLACSGSEVLDSLQRLQALGVFIYSCGLCLDFFSLKAELLVGEITNMYAIVEQITSASCIKI